MKIAFTGGGTGGHFYPIIAVAESIRDIVKERKLLEPELYFLGPSVFDERALYESDVTFIKTPAGKVRLYFSLMNYVDMLKTGWGIVKTFFTIYRLFPDVIFSKGGYGSVPTLIAARILGIPVIAHDSDAIPGRATMLAVPFAKKIALSYDEASLKIPDKYKQKVAVVGNPVRRDVSVPARDGAQEFLDLEPNVPVLVILGGSLGAEKINDTVLQALPELVQNYQVIHQTGQAHIKEVTETSKVILDRNERRYRYKPYGYLAPLAMKMAAGAADLIVSRAGSGSIAEIAMWGKASIVLPIPKHVSRDQAENAYAFARAKATTVIEQNNLTPHVLLAEIERLFTNPKARNDMAEAAKKFSKPDAAKALATAILDMALAHDV